MKRATVRCLHIMTTHGEEFWRPLLGTGFHQINFLSSINESFRYS